MYCIGISVLDFVIFTSRWLTLVWLAHWITLKLIKLTSTDSKQTRKVWLFCRFFGIIKPV